MRKIRTDLEKLRVPAKPLTFLTEEGPQTEEGKKIISDLTKVMEKNENILALSAPQIGINKRIFCLRFNDQIKTFINPIITKKSGIVVAVETCASMPGKEIVVGRPEEVTVVYYNDDFKYEDNKLVGVAASLFDQQAQILDGVMPDELGLVSDIEEDGKIEDTDMEEIVTFYKNTFLPSKLNTLQTAISADEEVSKTFNQLKFTEGVINNRIAVIESEEEAKKRAEAKKAAKASLKATEKAAQKADFNNYVSKLSKKKHK